jgi:CheY-like chemotaxis protein
LCIGGSSVAKILVADDNSNIQKMVVLALKDQGIEVVAVGNGEAAVRKISDLKPDLVLADIFMPVRNGYEVCKFVKDNSALSHIPVILLVGAFDPLDEQEAQRVGADGVLKKPFVPPDPLISMVKSSLSRAGVSVGAATAPPPPVPAATKSEPPPVPRIVPKPVLAPPAEEEIYAPAASSTKPAPFTIDKGSQPLAFGSLLESAGVEEDAVFAISPSAADVTERDWAGSDAAAAAAEEEEEETEEAAETGSWRVSSLPDTVDETPAGQTDWREAAFSGIGSAPGEKSHTAGWAPTVEKNSLSITEEEAATLAREQESFSVPVNGRGQENWGKAIQEVLPEKTAVMQTAQATASIPPPPPPPISLPSIASEPTPSEERLDTSSWKSGAGNAWEAASTNQLASSWDSAVASPAAAIEESAPAESPVASETEHVEAAPEEAAHPGYAAESLLEEAHPSEASSVEQEVEHMASMLPAIETLITPETQEILQEEAANAVANETTDTQHISDSAASVSSEPAAPTPPNMDEIVAKVLAKMNPEVMQAVTREILRPLVQAMIKDELDKK